MGHCCQDDRYCVNPEPFRHSLVRPLQFAAVDSFGRKVFMSPAVMLKKLLCCEKVKEGVLF